MSFSPRDHAVSWTVGALLVAGLALSWSAARLQSARSASGPLHQEVLPPARVLVRTGFLTGRLAETSGIAVGRKDSDVLWSHNDSGGRARLFAISIDGSNLGRVDVEGAGFVDWEAISAGPCPAGWEVPDCLWIGDIGDNLARRRDGTIYVVAEPDPDQDEIELGGKFDVTYAEGAADAEALAVAEDGTLVIVTKGRDGSVRLYEMPPEQVAHALGSPDRVTLEHPTRLPILPDARRRRLVTGAAFDSAGALAVRTYLEVFMFERAGEGWVMAGGCHFWDRNLSGEAIDFLPDGQMVLTGEEEGSKPAEIFRARCGESPDEN